MKNLRLIALLGGWLMASGSCAVAAADGDTSDLHGGGLRPSDVFELEFASDPQISPDGELIVYVRNFMDVMTDRRQGHLWMLRTDGSDHRPLTSGDRSDSSPQWSPDGRRLLFVSTIDGSPQIECYWQDTGRMATISRLTAAPSGVRWSPDGRQIAFSMFVPAHPESWIQMPDKPEGAQWAESPRVITSLRYRADGAGYLRDGYRHLFVLSAEGGTPRQLTEGDFDHAADFCWSPDSGSLIFSANRRDDHDLEPLDSNLFEIRIADRSLQQLTDRYGPDDSPTVSPDGQRIAFVGFDDRYQGYQVQQLYVADRDGSNARPVTADLDRSVRAPSWNHSGTQICFLYDDRGDTRLAATDLQGGITVWATEVGGETIGRPYAGGSFSHSDQGLLCYTTCRPDHPADVAVVRDRPGNSTRLTDLNGDLFIDRELGRVESFEVPSSFDGRPIQAWIVYPPGFDRASSYPLVLEIHGGPFANYGPRFSAEMQLYAAAGYVVLYVNPRGSTSYGEEFGNLIHHDYPGQDYDDLMSAVDHVIALGYVDSDRLFVTGGSGGGVLTSWIVGKTDRFRAAVVAKPVINWYSFALTADMYNFFYKYWFPGPPWEYPDDYLRRSPLSLVGNVTTPTMLLTGEEDYRTPISESEQYYQALQLRGVETALVRVPGASHGIAARPSHLIAKTAYILKWFEMHDAMRDEVASEDRSADPGHSGSTTNREAGPGR